MADSKYDLAVIGSGPAGQKAAINAAKLRKRVAVIDRTAVIGGVSVHTGTIPSKTTREAILHLTGFTERTFYGRDYSVKNQISIQDLTFRIQAIVERETEVIRAQLKRNQVTVIDGTARFIDQHTLEVEGPNGMSQVAAENILIACGTRPAEDPKVPIDGKQVLHAEQLPLMAAVPRSAIVVGAGVIGLEYASFLAALGVKVILIDQRPTILDYLDREIVESLTYHLRDLRTTFRLGEKVTMVGIEEGRGQVFAELESGKRVLGDVLLYAVGRQANADMLRLEAVGIAVDARGRVKVNPAFQTTVPNIYAAGDVIGFPALASTSMEQGRLSACHMFGVAAQPIPDAFPYGIYTIPEISMVGQTEEQLTAANVPYEVGTAKYAELAKSMMLGDEHGMLKLLFHRKSLKLLGVHAIGERATEIIHIGQSVMSFDGTIEYFRDSVFNYPTLAEAYKVAALDGLNKL
jgi:NAD(P) transhydrogenase